MNKIKTNPVFRKLYNDKNRFLLLYGGAGSGKSIFAGQKILSRMLVGNNQRILLLRKVHKSVRYSQFQLLKDLIYEYNLKSFIPIDSRLEIQGPRNNMILSAGLDDVEKLKSIQGITSVWIEEATEIMNQRDFTQINLRLRGKCNTYHQIMLSFNPIDNQHWIKKHFFDKIQNNTTTLKTTYKDNEYLEDEYIQELQNLENIDTTSHKIYTKGEWATPQHIIYPKWELFDRPPTNAEVKIFGLDFGFRVPTALIECIINGNDLFLTERLYDREITNSDLINKLPGLIENRKDFIYADDAEPDRIEEIYREQFNIHKSNKNVKTGIDYLKRFNIYINKESSNLQKEIQGYKNKEDKNGNVLDEPVKHNDHLLDAARYAVYTYGLEYLSGGKFSLPGGKSEGKASIRGSRSKYNYSNFNTMGVK